MFSRKKFREAWANGKVKLKANCTRQGDSVFLYETAVTKIEKGFCNNTYIVQLFTGGFYTASTKAIINEVLFCLDMPYRLFQKKGDWFIERVGSGETIPFSEGVKLF